MRKNLTLLFLLVALSSHAHASDPTPLFIIFVAIPLIVFAALVFILCLSFPKAGLVASGILFLAQFLIIGWASNVGYMESSGAWVGVSLLINITGIGLAYYKLNKIKEDENQKST